MADKMEINLNDLLDSEGIKKQIRIAKTPYDFTTIGKKRIDEYLEEGWELAVKNKYSFKMKRLNGKNGHIDHLSPFLKDHPLPDGKTTPQVNILF